MFKCCSYKPKVLCTKAICKFNVEEGLNWILCKFCSSICSLQLPFYCRWTIILLIAVCRDLFSLSKCICVCLSKYLYSTFCCINEVLLSQNVANYSKELGLEINREQMLRWNTWCNVRFFKWRVLYKRRLDELFSMLGNEEHVDCL